MLKKGRREGERKSKLEKELRGRKREREKSLREKEGLRIYHRGKETAIFQQSSPSLFLMKVKVLIEDMAEIKMTKMFVERERGGRGCW